MEPDLPLSFFDAPKNAAERASENRVIASDASCISELNREIQTPGLKDGIGFFINTFPAIDRAIFAQEFESRKDHVERLKKLNDDLVSCQWRTEQIHKAAAAASYAIYKQTHEKDSVPDGYYLKNRSTDFFIFPGSGVQAYVIRPKPPNSANLPPIISFRGTHGIQGLVSDSSYGADQLKNIRVKFTQWINQLKAENNHELVVTGHSLGGGLAQAAVGLMPDEPGFRVQLVTFNGFGGRDAIKAFEIENHVPPSKRNYKTFQPTRDAVGYRMDGDVVSLLGARFGETRTIPSPLWKIDVFGNHDMKTVLAEMKSHPHLFTSLAPKDVSPPVRPLTAIALGIAGVKSLSGMLNDKLFEITDPKCNKPFDERAKHHSGCQYPDGDALACFKKGEFERTHDNLQQSMQNYKLGCDLCHKESCVQFAVLNKIIGREGAVLEIAKKSCRLGDTASCVEAGTILNEDKFNFEDKTRDTYITQACILGEKSVCSSTNDPLFYSQYAALKSGLCESISTMLNCELHFLSTLSSSNPQMNNRKIFVRLSEILSQNGANVDVVDKFGRTPLMAAIQAGNLPTIKLLMSRGAMIRGSDPKYAELLLAAETGTPEVLKYFIDKYGKHSVRSPDSSHNLLIAATRANQFENVKLLLSLGADINAKDVAGDTPIEIAAQRGNLEVLKYLRVKGARLEPTLLDKTMVSGDVCTLKYLCENGYKLDKHDLMDRAIASKNLEMVRYLVSQGAKLELSPHQASEMLINVGLTGSPEIARKLLEQGARINHKDQEGDTPLLVASRTENTEVVKFLLQSGADIQIKDREGDTPLMLAILHRSPNNVKLLLDKGAANGLSEAEWYHLIYTAAAHSKNVEPDKFKAAVDVFKLLLDQSEKTGFPIKNYTASLFYYAVDAENLEMVKYLVSKGLSVNDRNKNGEPPIVAAVRSENLEMVKYLIDHGASSSPSLEKIANPEIRNYLDHINSPYDVTKSH